MTEVAEAFATPLNTEETRVLGCLIEKQLTVPDTYPMSLNSLVLACNQLQNREPIVRYDDGVVEVALGSLRQQHLARIIRAGAGSRVDKHKHVFNETIGVSVDEMAVLAVMMLRGPQTLNELKTRTERMCGFDDLAEVEHTLDGLINRMAGPLVAKMERQPGQKEQRYAQLCSGEPAMPIASENSGTGSSAGTHTRLAELEALVAEHSTQVASLVHRIEALETFKAQLDG